MKIFLAFAKQGWYTVLIPAWGAFELNIEGLQP